MTQEDKDLLLKDLSARLPYGVKGIITYNGDKDIFTVKGIFNILFLSDTECCHVEDFKSYLRPMSSMTEEEKETYRIIIKSLFENSVTNNIATLYNFLNSKHLDYNGLIPLGLAIEVTEENNPYKE